MSLVALRDGSEAPAAERPLFLQRPYYENGQRGFKDKGPGFGLRKGAWKYFEAPEVWTPEGLSSLENYKRTQKPAPAKAES